jgi:hypothetical protein
MLHDYFSSSVRARSLAIAAQKIFLEKIEEPLLVFTSLWFDIHAITFWLPSEKYKIVLWKKKNLNTSKISLFSFRLYSIIDGDNLRISTISTNKIAMRLVGRTYIEVVLHLGP